MINGRRTGRRDPEGVIGARRDADQVIGAERLRSRERARSGHAHDVAIALVDEPERGVRPGDDRGSGGIGVGTIIVSCRPFALRCHSVDAAYPGVLIDVVRDPQCSVRSGGDAERYVPRARGPELGDRDLWGPGRGTRTITACAPPRGWRRTARRNARESGTPGGQGGHHCGSGGEQTTCDIFFTLTLLNCSGPRGRAPPRSLRFPAPALLAAVFGLLALRRRRDRARTQTAALVSLIPSLTEDLFAIGAGPQVVGVSQFTDFPPAATRLPGLRRFRPSTPRRSCGCIRPSSSASPRRRRWSATCARLGLRVVLMSRRLVRRHLQPTSTSLGRLSGPLR